MTWPFIRKYITGFTRVEAPFRWRTQNISEDNDCNSRAVKAIEMSTSGDGVDLEAYFRAAGFDGYLTKPIDTRTFANQLETFLSRAKPSKKMLP